MPRPILRRAPVIIGSSLFILVAAGCEPTYYAGEPPADAVLEVRSVRIDTTYDAENRRTVRLAIESKWEIEQDDFGSRQYHYGLVFEHGVGVADSGWMWTPKPTARRIANAVDSLRDTLSCAAETCYWPGPRVHVLTELRPGRFLSVARGSIPLPGEVSP